MDKAEKAKAAQAAKTPRHIRVPSNAIEAYFTKYALTKGVTRGHVVPAGEGYYHLYGDYFGSYNRIFVSARYVHFTEGAAQAAVRRLRENKVKNLTKQLKAMQELIDAPRPLPATFNYTFELGAPEVADDDELLPE